MMQKALRPPTSVEGVIPIPEEARPPDRPCPANVQGLLESCRSRLLAPVWRAAEVVDLLALDIGERDGRFSLGGEQVVALTLWWPAGPGGGGPR